LDNCLHCLAVRVRVKVADEWAATTAACAGSDYDMMAMVTRALTVWGTGEQ